MRLLLLYNGYVIIRLPRFRIIRSLTKIYFLKYKLLWAPIIISKIASMENYRNIMFILKMARDFPFENYPLHSYYL